MKKIKKGKLDYKKYRLTTPRCKIDQAAADKAVQFFQGYLQHTKGPCAKKPFILAPWQEHDIIRPLLGTLNPDGSRQYRTAYIELAKKNGKSEIAAGVALYFLLADREMGGEVYSAAADKGQASIVFGVAAQMVRQNAKLTSRCKIIDSTKRITVQKTASFYGAVSADAFTKHGVNPSAVIFDELHAQPNRLLWDVFTSSSDTRKQPLVIAITNAGYDTHSICYEQHDYALKVIRGVIKDPTFFAYICTVPEDEDWTDERLWHAVNPALGDFLNYSGVKQQADKARHTPSLENTFRRFRLTQWVKQEVRWMSLELWDESAGEVNLEELLGMDCYVGLDLASSVDIAAVVFVFPFGDSFKVLPFFFIPEENITERVKRDRVPYDVWQRQGHLIATEGNVIDYKAISGKIEEMNEKVHICEIAFDRWGMTQLSQDLTGEGYEMVPFGQGFASMSGPTKEMMTLVKGKRLAHGGHPVLRWMIDNVMVTEDPAGNQKPDKKKSREKIDGVVATIMGLGRAITHMNVGRSVYEDHGITSI